MKSHVLMESMLFLSVVPTSQYCVPPFTCTPFLNQATTRVQQPLPKFWKFFGSLVAPERAVPGRPEASE